MSVPVALLEALDKRRDLADECVCPATPDPEQNGRCPVLVVSHDGFNQTQTWKSIIVVPITTSASRA
jgi:hypothetical protein